MEDSLLAKQKVFGRQHALTVEAVERQKGTLKWPRLNFEFASVLPETGERGTKQYNWGEKLIIQLKEDHMPLYAAVLLGDLHRVRFDHYGGASGSKSFEMEAQGSSIVIKGLAPGRGHAIPIPAERVYWLIAQVMWRLRIAHPSLDTITARAMIRRSAELWTAETHSKGE